MKLDRKQDPNVLYQVCVFRTDRKNKMAALANPSKNGTLYSGARYVALWASCFLCRKDPGGATQPPPNILKN